MHRSKFISIRWHRPPDGRVCGIDAHRRSDDQLRALVV